MKKKSWHLNRRTFLRGSGLGLALPFMNAMTANSNSKPPVIPKRAAFIFFPNGVALPSEKDPQYEDWHWFPRGEGGNYEFRTSQIHLNPYRSDISVISGLSNPANRNVASHMGSSGFLTSRTVSKTSVTNSISIDQKIAGKIGKETQLSSLVLSSVGGVGSLNRTYTMSFDHKGKAIPALSKLKHVYARMYMAGTPAAKARLTKKQHLLNEVYQDAKDLRRLLGKEDQYTLDEYLSSITDLEKKVENDKFWANKMSSAKAPEVNLNIEAQEVEDYIQTMYELIYLSFKSDITRVVTYQIASEGGESPVGFMSKSIGLKKDLHSLSHGAGKGDEGYKNWGAWDQFISKQLAHFIKRLKETPEAETSLLDNCLLFHGSATGKSHDPHNYPLILAGGKNMGHKSGQFIKYEEKNNALSNLYVKIAQAMGVPLKEFGDSTGIPMNGLIS